MRIFHGFYNLPLFKHPVVSVGSYDGVHLGHQAIIKRLIIEAQAKGGESIVLTFEPHPRITLQSGEKLRLLTTFDEKAALLNQYGVENLIVIPFNRQFSILSGREFVTRYLVGKLGAETLVAGYNHRFGHDRCYARNITSLLLQIVLVELCYIAGQRVSSSVIRNLLDESKIREAEQLLGHLINIKLKK